jgi:hypothetical protein
MHHYYDKLWPEARYVELERENQRLKKELSKHIQEDLEVEEWVAQGIRRTEYLKKFATRGDPSDPSEIRYHGG